MPIPTLSYTEHAAVYSIALVFLFRVIGQSVPALSDALSQKAYRRLVIYCTGLCLLRKHQTCANIADKIGGPSHDGLTRFLNGGKEVIPLLMLGCFQIALYFCQVGPCWLILDDVIIPKPYAKKMFAAYFDYDHVEEKNVRCLRVVVLCWTNGYIKIPVAFALWHKKGGAYLEVSKTRFRTKNQLARILVWKVKRSRLRFDFLTFDSWYASAENLETFHRWGIFFVCAIKCNRDLGLPSFPLSEAPHTKKKDRKHLLWKTRKPTQYASTYPHSRDYKYYRKVRCRARRWPVFIPEVPTCLTLVCIKNYAKTKAFKEMVTPADKKVKDPNKYLITNDCDLTPVQIIQRYKNRWAIEVLFRDCKQHLGLCAYQGQTVEAHQLHIACVFFSYAMMEMLKNQVGDSELEAHTLSIGDVKTWLENQYLLLIPKEGQPACWVTLTVPTQQTLEEMMRVQLPLTETESPRFLEDQLTDFLQLKMTA